MIIQNVEKCCIIYNNVVELVYNAQLTLEKGHLYAVFYPKAGRENKRMASVDAKDD